MSPLPAARIASSVSATLGSIHTPSPGEVAGSILMRSAHSLGLNALGKKASGFHLSAMAPPPHAS